MNAASKDSKVEGFEVGVFNGEYVTGVPDGYFEHLSNLRKGTKKRKAAMAGLPPSGGPTDKPRSAVVVTNGGPVIDVGPEYREDVRFVTTHDISRWPMLTYCAY